MKRISLLIVLGSAAGTAYAQAFTESFDSGTYSSTSIVSDVTWVAQNNSDGTHLTDWFDGNTLVFAPHAGAGYAAANFQNTDPRGDISNWMMSPTRTFQNGDTVSFWTRTTVNPSSFPDRLQVRMSTNGNSTNVGTTSSDLGDFTTLLLEINQGQTSTGYPATWTNYVATVSGLGGPTSGRFAFRYHVIDSGINGLNGDYIGIDTVAYTPIPEPGSMVALGLGVAALLARRRARKS